jgi:hypothetical protein
MCKTLANSTLVVLLVVGVSFGKNPDRPSVVELTGVVVAYDEEEASVPCYLKTCGGSLLIRIDATEHRYVRIYYQTNKFPRQLISTNAHWRFRVVRTEARDEPLPEFTFYEADRYSAARRVRIWRVVSTGEKLPFEQTITSYSLVKDGFKQTRWP